MVCVFSVYMYLLSCNVFSFHKLPKAHFLVLFLQGWLPGYYFFRSTYYLQLKCPSLDHKIQGSGDWRCLCFACDLSFFFLIYSESVNLICVQSGSFYDTIWHFCMFLACLILPHPTSLFYPLPQCLCVSLRFLSSFQKLFCISEVKKILHFVLIMIFYFSI